MSIDPIAKLAYAESQIHDFSNILTDLELTYNDTISEGEASGVDMNELMTQINSVKALLTHFRNEASFWRQEIENTKNANKETNKLSEA